MSKLPLVEGLLKYVDEKNSMFCMPGHKAGEGFLYTDIGVKFYESIIKCDLTEVDGLDNLHNPEGIIKEAQKLLSDFYGSKKSYFLVNGSSSGNLTVIYSQFNEGDKIIVERNCHRSIFNGIIMRKLNPIYLKNKVDKGFNAPLSIDENELIDIMDENLDAKGILITYPNYYGVCCNLSKVIYEAHKRGIKVFVDSAHGAHFGVHEALPENAVSLGADMVVMSSHKTLPSFTQTAYLHIGKDIDEEKVDFYTSAFLSTSPSFMLMASMDYGRYFLEEKGKESYGKLIKFLKNYKNKINELEGFHVIELEDLNVYNIDITRYVLHVSKGYSGFKLYNYLKENNIQPEMSDGSNVVLIFSPFNKELEIERLYEILKNCDLEKLKEKAKEIIDTKIPYKVMLPYEALDRQKEKIMYIEAEGKICGEAIVPYPPGIPIVVPGEIIDKKVIKNINYYLSINNKVIGINEKRMIKIITEEKMGKIFCIIGKSGSGKDTVFKALKDDDHLNLKGIVLYTTRPKRDSETDGIEYHFVKEEELKKFQVENKIIELRQYNTVKGKWYYCTIDDGQIDLKRYNYIMITTLEAYKKLQEYFGEDSIKPVYINLDDGTRLKRALDREMMQENPNYEELCRRFLADSIDFNEDKLKACKIDNFYLNYELDECIKNIREYIKCNQV